MVAAPLTDQQAAVLQAIYNHFRDHGTWPTFITIDRPIRRQHRWDTGPIILSLPESLIGMRQASAGYGCRTVPSRSKPATRPTSVLAAPGMPVPPPPGPS